jgi:hypothetical protein
MFSLGGWREVGQPGMPAGERPGGFTASNARKIFIGSVLPGLSHRPALRFTGAGFLRHQLTKSHRDPWPRASENFGRLMPIQDFHYS